MSKEKENLQSALQNLEKIVDDLSGSDVEVEIGLKKFKEGVSLIKFCRSQLREVENEFKKLKDELETDEKGNKENENELNAGDLPL